MCCGLQSTDWSRHPSLSCFASKPRRGLFLLYTPRFYILQIYAKPHSDLNTYTA